MQLGETIATYDVDLALRGESGKFEVTSPMCETYYVTCKPNTSGSRSQSLDGQSYAQAFLVKKIAESVSLEQPSRALANLEERSGPSDAGAPFLLEKQNTRDQPLSDKSLEDELPVALEAAGKVWSMDLFYREGATEEPCASVCLVREGEDSGKDLHSNSLTPPCRNFNDFDSEIRRLQAQLEDIRSRVKKKFYKAQAAAAGA